MIFSIKVDAILSEKGMFLGNIGINNWALSKSEALYALDILNVNNIPILGGDVYELRCGTIEPNYDNWYYERDFSDSDEEYISKSIQYAKEYIRNYYIEDSNVCFAFVI